MRQQAFVFEYKKAKSHKYIKSRPQKDNHMNSETGYKIWSTTIPYKNKSVKVTVEFPAQSDLKACQELTDRLKAMYLEKMCGNEMNHE